MDCRNMDILLSAYADGDVSYEEAKIVEEHVDICPACAKSLKDYKEITSLALSLKQDITCDANLDKDLERIWDKILDRIDEEENHKGVVKSILDFLFRNYRRWQLNPKLAGATLILLLLFISHTIWVYTPHHRCLMEQKPRRLTRREMMNIVGGNLPSGSVFQTDHWQTADILLRNKHRLKVNQDTFLEVWEENKRYTIRLEQGEVWTSVQDEVEKFEVRSFLTVIEAKGAEFYVKVDGVKVTVTVTYGKVLFRTGSNEQEVYAGTKCFTYLGGDISELEEVTIKEASRWARW